MIKAIKILAAFQPTGTIVEIDGVPIRNVRCVTFRHRANEVPVLTLEIFALGGVIIEGEADVQEELLLPGGVEQDGGEV